MGRVGPAYRWAPPGLSIAVAVGLHKSRRPAVSCRPSSARASRSPARCSPRRGTDQVHGGKSLDTTSDSFFTVLGFIPVLGWGQAKPRASTRLHEKEINSSLFPMFELNARPISAYMQLACVESKL